MASLKAPRCLRRAWLCFLLLEASRGLRFPLATFLPGAHAGAWRAWRARLAHTALGLSFPAPFGSYKRETKRLGRGAWPAEWVVAGTAVAVCGVKLSLESRPPRLRCFSSPRTITHLQDPSLPQVPPAVSRGARLAVQGCWLPQGEGEAAGAGRAGSLQLPAPQSLLVALGT